MNREDFDYMPRYETDTTDMSRVVFNNDLHEVPVILFDPAGNEVGRTSSEVQFYDALLQIKRKALTGYSCAMADEPTVKYAIDVDGRVRNRPQAMFGLFESMLDDMIFG